MSPRLRAFLIHFTASATILAAFTAITLLWWYPGPLLVLQGGQGVLLMLLTVDVVLGPSLTGLIYKPGKWGLKFDLTVIVLVQLAALSYGVMTIYAQRTHYLAFTLDRFFVVSMMDTVGELPREKYFTTWRSNVLLATSPTTDLTTPSSLSDLETAGVDETLIPPLAIIAADQGTYPGTHRPTPNSGTAIADIADDGIRNLALARLKRLGLDADTVRAYRVIGKKNNALALVDLRNSEVLDILR
jgi:hypothetical protein